ncbi:ubiquitin specific protease 48 isoform b, partial [Thamnocephalis sphaerospora]
RFCKLFLTLLSSVFSSQPDAGVRDLIAHRFGGEQTYNTQCTGCNQPSLRNEQFYELEVALKDGCSLEESLEEILKPEVLDGPNQYVIYHCGVCGSKQDAARSLHLKRLPPVLNFQLMRFVYDMETYTKKKSDAAIRFPAVLDMRHFSVDDGDGTSDNGKDLVYELTAVLIHQGAYAHYGHYIAHVRRST